MFEMDVFDNCGLLMFDKIDWRMSVRNESMAYINSIEDLFHELQDE
jgi:hypothetical protein